MTEIEHQADFDEVLWKIGKNVLNFQRMEAMLKFLISYSTLEGSASELRSKHEKAVDAVSRQTMGNLVKSFLASAYSEPSEEIAPVAENKELWFSFSFKIEADQEFIEQRQAALCAVVEERNILIHQKLGLFDHTSAESCRELSGFLDAQAERVRPELEALRSLVVALQKGRKEVVATMEKTLKTES